jgi:branched-chain amino acid transport system substrate-binding protein
MNDRGGLDGHLVRFSAADDGADPARHRALVQEMIERDHVIAFVQQILSPAGQGSVKYIQEHRVPIIGTDVGSQWVYDSPMIFPQVPSGDAVYLGNLYGFAREMLPQGRKRVGWVVCVEVESVCGRIDRMLQERVADAGFELAYRGKASLVQPDYTAECLAARSAGVEAFMIYLDSASIERLAASCARQGFRPIYSAPASLVADRFRTNPNLEAFVGALNVFGPQQADTPATREFQEAMGRYLPNQPPEVAHATGWASAKLFERAAASLPEPPTSEAVLRGLWSIRADTLGGISPAPLTFLEGRSATQMICWNTVVVRSGRWESPNGYRPLCHA